MHIRQHVVAELLPLTKKTLCCVDKVLNASLWYLSPANLAYKLLGIIRKETECKRKHIIMAHYNAVYRSRASGLDLKGTYLLE